MTDLTAQELYTLIGEKTDKISKDNGYDNTWIEVDSSVWEIGYISALGSKEFAKSGTELHSLIDYLNSI